jgi:hypothetical protein
MKALFNKKFCSFPSGQVMIEFTFAMLVVMFMMWSTVMIFRWAGKDLAERRISHDLSLRDPSVDQDWSVVSESPLKQIDPYFHDPIELNAIFGDW